MKLNFTVLFFSISKFTISFSSLRFKFELYIIAKTLSSFLFPRFISSTVYSTYEPGDVVVGPVIFLITTKLSSLIRLMLISLFFVSALRLVQIVSLFSSVNFV